MRRSPRHPPSPMRAYLAPHCSSPATTGRACCSTRTTDSAFHPWATSNGIFISGTGPALAAGCLGTTGEASAYGMATDNRIWVSPVLDVNAVNWTPIGTTTFRSVAASAWLDTVTVTGRASAGAGSDFQGLSTSVTSPACTSSSACGATAFCEFRGNSCGGKASCSYKPTKCPDTIAPVCGCDGITYGNDCERQAGGTSKQSDGFCP